MGSTNSHWFLNYRGKDPRKPKRFSWSVQGSLRGNRNPLRLFFFCQRFLLEKQKKMLCRTCKFAAVHRPLCSFPETPEASPMRGSCRRRRLMRWTTPRRRNCPHLIRHGSAVPPSPRRGRLWCSKNRKSSRKKVQPDKFRLHLLFTADILRQLLTNLIYRIRRRVPRRP